jgi:hypothetical protein
MQDLAAPFNGCPLFRTSQRLRVAEQRNHATIRSLPYQPTGLCRIVMIIAACPSWRPLVSHLRQPLTHTIASLRCLPVIGANASSRFCLMAFVGGKCLIGVLIPWRSYQLDPRKSKSSPVLPIAWSSLVVSPVICAMRLSDPE